MCALEGRIDMLKKKYRKKRRRKIKERIQANQRRSNENLQRIKPNRMTQNYYNTDKKAFFQNIKIESKPRLKELMKKKKA